MRDAFELAVAALLALGGIRSLWVWSRRPFASRAFRDHVLYAMHLTGRIGLWFAFAAIFLGYAVLKHPEDFRWFVIVPVVLAAVMTMTAMLLGRSGPRS